MLGAHAALDFDADRSRTIGKIDLTTMRRLNAIRILDAVRRYGPISRANLAKQSRLSPPAVSALVDDLIVKRGLLREVGRDVSTGGRRATLVSFAADRGCVVGVDLGSTTVRYALADLNGRVLARVAEPTGNPSPGRVVRQMSAGIRALLGHSTDRPPLLAIGVGAPGMTDVQRGVVIEAANLRGWKDVALKHLVAAEFNVPVAVDNDVNMAALGEYWMGCAKGEPNFVFVALGRGVGAGIMIDGRVHRGRQWYAGEISHLLLDYEQWQRDFGSQGYLEHHIGAAAIARKWRRVSRAGRGAPVEIAALFAAARQGNAAATRLVTHVATILGVAVANVITTLDPALVVFGGGIGQVGEQLLAPVREVVGR
ncbi:MAG: ROK family transcriptional regulator, partial [Acidobacteria bacterium]|nr:ROK family transcriptional regulator [Acidobacteriota bacterium]